ncbi:hypothetical protein LEN26_013119 [Aphanomyces euteiches]|nr:hypothetical protein AeMF1_014269 [Aphanomyces euteiches]KAH9113622.1 hypothetical protein LEN26_013119 [Aphanomyces euteiches]KAH9185375.1 hypothetical protein AeNC1_012648 [Aphanomyces euteiches]
MSKTEHDRDESPSTPLDETRSLPGDEILLLESLEPLTSNEKPLDTAPSNPGEQTLQRESLNPPVSQRTTTDNSSRESQSNPNSNHEMDNNKFNTLKRLTEAQQNEINLLRAKSEANEKPPLTIRSSECETRDLLKKVKFAGKHFSFFKIKFKNICQLRHIWDIITGEEAPPNDGAPEVEVFQYEDRISVARSYLQTCLSNEIFELVREDSTPAEMWNTLVANNETKGWSNTIYALRRLGHMRYDPKTYMMKHINLVRSTIRQLNDMVKTINEQQTVEWILMPLPDSGPDNYNTFMNHLKPTPDHKVTLKTLMGALLNEKKNAESVVVIAVKIGTSDTITSTDTRTTEAQHD